MIDRALEEALSAKKRLLERLESKLDAKELEEAKRDPHARRKPRPCGLTVHPAVGCDRGCLYCYVPSVVGYAGPPKLSPLSPEQLAYALAANPYFLPGPLGTLLAFGSVTEPFANEAVVEKTLGFLKAAKDYLRNPVQVATKASPSQAPVEEIAKHAEPKASFLVTIVSLRLAKELEPRAPSPEERLELLAELSKAGFHASLFLRPILPGVAEVEYKELLAAAKEAGAFGVVAGCLLVSKEVLRKLSAVEGVARALSARLRDAPEKGLASVSCKDVKSSVLGFAKLLDLRAYPSSCSANIDSHGLACAACSMGPCGSGAIPPADGDSVARAAELLGAEVLSAKVLGNRVELALKKMPEAPADVLKTLLETVTKRKVLLRAPRESKMGKFAQAGSSNTHK